MSIEPQKNKIEMEKNNTISKSFTEDALVSLPPRK